LKSNGNGAAAIAATEGGNEEDNKEEDTTVDKKDEKIEDIEKKIVKDMVELEELEEAKKEVGKGIEELEKLEKEIGGEKKKDTVNLSLADKILGSISYKLKVGVDYEITPQIVGAVGITVGGQLSGFKPPIKMPDATLEVGICYNF
jgi:hypothetical protein